MNVLSLFTGIGGMDLGLERAGMRVVGQCEADAWCRSVLTRHWPGVPCCPDICALDAEFLAQCGPIDVVAGGFPCQDISQLGNRKGLTGERSGLWYEMLRTIRLCRPRYVVIENVANLLHRGMDTVLSGLAACGFDAEWQVLPAGAFGAPHIRTRVFVVAYTPRGTDARGVFSRSEKPAGVLRQQPRGDFGIEVPGSDWQTDKPSFSCVDDGAPDWTRVARSTGNAVVPAVAEFVGRCVMDHARARITTPD